MKYTVASQQTLLDAVALMAPDSSKTSLRSWIKEGRIQVDGFCKKITSLPVEPGQVITLTPKAKLTDEGDVRIIYEDQHLVVIDKPAGLLSVATAFEKGDTAHGFLKKFYKPAKIQVVHRLDQETSGVMMFAKTDEAYEILKKMFESHELDRAYMAVVEGPMEEETGKWECYLYEDANYVVHKTNIPQNGRLAITHFETVQKTKKYSLLRLRLETGRKNQIRVHCQLAGHSIVGDRKYGAVSNPAKRLCLHAYLLGFNHPITGKKMHFESPLPEEFKLLMK